MALLVAGDHTAARDILILVACPSTWSQDTVQAQVAAQRAKFWSMVQQQLGSVFVSVACVTSGGIIGTMHNEIRGPC